MLSVGGLESVSYVFDVGRYGIRTARYIGQSLGFVASEFGVNAKYCGCARLYFYCNSLTAYEQRSNGWLCPVIAECVSSKSS